MKLKIICLFFLGALGSVSVPAGELTLSYDRQGLLTWSNPGSNAHYRIEWAGQVNGPWNKFQELSRLDAIESTGSVSTVRVPVFYRAVQLPDTKESWEGLYRYTGYSTNGDLLVVGWWNLVTQTNQFAGNWTLGYAGTNLATEALQNVGPQIGQGKLEGQIDATQVSVNLNPGWADNNVFVHGTRTNSHYAGQWSWSTFPGPRAGGTFLLEKVSP